MSGLLKKLREKVGIEYVEPNADYEELDLIAEEENREMDYPVIEDPNPQTMRVEVVEENRPEQLLFRYFVDGSMRTMNIGHMIDTKGQCLPMFATQVAVATTKFHKREVGLENHHAKTILFIPNSLADEEVRDAQYVVTQANHTSRAPIKFELETYQVPASNSQKPIDEARKKILQTMHHMEINMITELASCGKVTTNEQLMIDGSLQFYQGLSKNLAAFKNVVGVAKSFNLQKLLGKGKTRQGVGAIVARLPHKHRTPAHGTTFRGITIASWYLRLHALQSIDRLQMADGVVKIEMFPEDPRAPEVKIENSRCQVVSRDILALRHPATPWTDPRWASHLYPIYLTEQYLKAHFQSAHVVRACL